MDGVGKQRQETESAGEFGRRLHWSGRALRWSEVNAMATYDVVRVRWQLRYCIRYIIMACTKRSIIAGIVTTGS